MDKQEIKAKITECLLRKVKFVGEDETTYYGIPTELIDVLCEALQDYKVEKI